MHPSDDPKEKREYSRQPVIALVRVWQIAFKGFAYAGKVLNISPKGIYIETDALLARKELFKVEIVQSRDLIAGETCLCGVVWDHQARDSNSGFYGYGVQFLRPPPSLHLGSFLAQPALGV